VPRDICMELASNFATVHVQLILFHLSLRNCSATVVGQFYNSLESDSIGTYAYIYLPQRMAINQAENTIYIVSCDAMPHDGLLVQPCADKVMLFEIVLRVSVNEQCQFCCWRHAHRHRVGQYGNVGDDREISSSIDLARHP
jgi:hypothetical protein